MSNHRENALAFGLSRALAMIDSLKPGSSMSPAAQVWSEVEAFKEEMGKLLSARHTLRNPALHIPGLTDAAFVGTGAGWLIQLSTNPMEDANLCVGKVNLSEPPKDDYEHPSHTAVFFKLTADPTAVNHSNDGQKLADAVALFVRTVLDAKGMEGWNIDTVIVDKKVVSIGLGNSVVTFEREAYIPSVART